MLKKMKEHPQKMKVVSLRHLLVISLALNFGLISKVLFDGGDKRAHEFYCVTEKHDAEGPKSDDSRVEKKNKYLDTTTSSLSSHSTAANHDSSAVIDLDQ